MTSNFLLYLLFTFLISKGQGATIPAIDEQTCIDLCSSCDGDAKFEEGHCECNIADDVNQETECLGRMKRQAEDYGLDVVSCDLTNDRRTTRCTLGSKHTYGKNDIEQVAKYFMQDGPITGSVFVAPAYTDQAASLVGNSPDCILGASKAASSSSSPNVGSPKTDAAPNVGAPLITQPKEFMPVDSISSAAPAGNCVGAATPSSSDAVGAPLGAPLNSFGFQEMAPQFLSMLGDILTKPLLGLPHALQSVSQTPGVSDLVGAPRQLLNSWADSLAQKSAAAKEGLDNFREVVGKAKDDVKVGLANLKKTKQALLSNPTVGAPNPMQSMPTYMMMNPSPMISLWNPNVGSPMGQFVGAPAQFVGSQAPAQFISAPAQYVASTAPGQLPTAPSPAQLIGSSMPSQLVPTQLINAAQLVSGGQLVPNQQVGAQGNNQIVGSPRSGCDGQMVGSPALSSFAGQMVGAPAPMMIHSLGTIPLSSIVSQMSPTYLVGSPMTYYPAMQPIGMAQETVSEAEPESLEEVPLSSPAQKKICKKSTRDRPSMKFTRDVKAAEENKETAEKVEVTATTTTTTTEVPMIDRTTTQKPKVDKSVIAKIKPKKIKTEKKSVEHKL